MYLTDTKTATKYDTSLQTIQDIDIDYNVDISGSRVFCSQCHASNFRIGAGKGPHHASLICLSCNRHVKWLSRHQAQELSDQLPQSQTDSQLSLFEQGGEG